MSSPSKSAEGAVPAETNALVVHVNANAADPFEQHKKFSQFRKRKRRSGRKGEGEDGEGVDITINLSDLTSEQAIKDVIAAKDHFEVFWLEI